MCMEPRFFLVSHSSHATTPQRGKEANPSLSSNSQLDWVSTFLPLKLLESRLLQRYGTHIKFLTQLSPIFGRKSGNNNTRGDYLVPMAINT